MTKACKAVTSLLLLIVLAHAQPQTPFIANSYTPSPAGQDSSSGPRLQPVGSFPPEPVPLTVSPAVEIVVERANSLAERGDYAGALKFRAEALELARASKPFDEAFVLRGRTFDFFGQKKYDEALTGVSETVEASVRGGDTIGQVDELFRFAALMLDLEVNRTKADEMLAQALKLAQAETVRPGRMYRVMRAAGGMLRENSLSWSKTFYAAALDMARKYPDAVEETGLSSYDLANLAFQIGDFAQAESRLRENILLWNKLRANAAAHLADVNRLLDQANPRDLLLIEGYRTQGNNLEETRAYYGGQLARSHIRLGDIARAQGDSLSAGSSYDAAIMILGSERRDNLLTAEAYRNLGMLRLEEGELRLARRHLNTALGFSFESRSVAQKQQDKALEGRSIAETTQVEIALGMLAVEQHNYSSAENFLQVARANLAPEWVDRLAWAANNLAFGETFARMGNTRRAADYFPTALTVYQKFEMPLQIARVKLFTGSFEVGRTPEQSLKDLNDAREILSKFAPRSVMMARVLTSLAYRLGKERSDQEAVPLLLEAKTILERSAPKSITLPVVEHNLMDPIRKEGKLVEAEKLAFQSWDHVKKLSSEFAGEEAGEAYSSLFADYGAGLAWLQILQKKNEAAFVTLERTRARGLFQLLTQRKDVDKKQWLQHKTLLSDRYRAESDYEHAASASLVAGRNLTALRKGKADQFDISEAEGRLRQRQQEAYDAADVLVSATAGADIVWRDLLENTSPGDIPIDLLKMQKSLPAGTVYLMYSRDRDGFMVLALRGGSSEVVVETIDLKGLGLGDLASNFRDAFDAEPIEKDLPAIDAQGETLFKYLFPGRMRALALNAEHLVISPDSVLWNLPFAALVTGRNADKQPQYLGLLKPITYAQSLSLYLRTSQEVSNLKPGQKPLALVLGDPLFDLRPITTATNAGPAESDDNRGTVWASLRSRNLPPAPLPYSREEAKNVGCLLGAAPLVSGEANEQNVRQQIESADIIHLATHAVMRETMPMSSGIMLSPPAEDPPAGELDNDGVLQAWEIFSQLRLRAELVVLSACDTALGKTVRGEGIVGLTRAFQYAGARSLIASQWEVGDKSTNSLMLAFYEALSAGKQKDEALRLAMTKVATSRTTAHPHYWAAFTLTGASNNLNLRSAAATGCQ